MRRWSGCRVVGLRQGHDCQASGVDSQTVEDLAPGAVCVGDEEIRNPVQECADDLMMRRKCSGWKVVDGADDWHTGGTQDRCEKRIGGVGVLDMGDVGSVAPTCYKKPGGVSEIGQE